MEQISAIVEQMDFMTSNETRYKINRNGEIWSIKQSKFMKPHLNEYGYLQINLLFDDKKRHLFLHRLIAIQYIPNPDNLPEIDHIDRNKTNNNISNLHWVTRLENANNKTTNLTKEQKEQKVIDNRKYQAEWSMNKRREQGVPERKKFETDEERKEAERISHLKSSRTYRANMSADEKEIHLEKRRENGKTEEAKQAQRDYINIPEVKAKRAEAQRIKRAEMTPEQKAQGALRRKELYAKKKVEQKD